MDKEGLLILEMPHKYIMTHKDIFDNPISQNITALEIKSHGFNVVSSGGWSLYQLSKDDTPANFLIYKKFKKRKISTININEIENIT